MIATPAASSLDLTEAAAFLGLHPDTLRERAAAGIIPGAKIGKTWRFLDADLAAYLRAQYGGKACRSTEGRGRKSGTSTCAGAAGAELDALLARPTRGRRSASTTSLQLVSGKRARRGTA